MQLLFRATLVLLILQFSNTCTAQAPSLYLQLEQPNSIDLIKYYPGQTIKFTTKEYPDVWRQEKIVSLNPELNLIVLASGYVSIENISTIERKNIGPLIFGHLLSKIATSQLLNLTLSSLANTGEWIPWQIIVVGAVIIGAGWGIRKLFGQNQLAMDQMYRVSLKDSRFPSAGDIYSP